MSEVKISAAEVNKLRKATGAGMMDCKKALVEAGGDFDKAIDVLRKKGQKVAEKRADRDSSEGAAIAKVNDDNTTGVAIVLGCETDFVGKNESFVALANEMADNAINFDTKEDFLASDFNGISVSEKLVEQTGVIGEKLDINAFEKVSAPYVGSYVHINKIAAIVGLSAAVDNAETLAKDLAMQIASMGATTLSYKDFDPAYVANETEARIAAIEKENEELERLGKPEQIWDKILPGKMERFISDNTTLDQEQCLLDQKFIKDEKMTVADYVKSYGEVEITDFKRVNVG